MKLLVSSELSREIGEAPLAVLIGADTQLGPDDVFDHLRIWRFAHLPEAMLIYAADAPAPRDVFPWPGAPSGVVAVVTGDEAAAAAVVEAWRAAGGQAPPEIIDARQAGAVIRKIADAAAREAWLVAQRCVAANKALAAVRAELDETKVAMAKLTRQLASQPPPAGGLVIDAAPASEGECAKLRSDSRLRQTLGVAIESISAVEIHIGSPAGAGGNAVLTARLVALESGRIVGAWRIPVADLVPGWLTLDLPTPAAPLRQTACLELNLEGRPSDTLLFSLEAGRGEAQTVYDGGEPSLDDRGLALRVSTAALGGRFVAARYWSWDEIGASLPLENLRLSLPDLTPFRLLGGEAKSVARGGQAKPMLALASQPSAVAALPLAPVSAAVAVSVTLNVVNGSAQALEAGLWLSPAALTLTSLDDLQRHADLMKFSGKRAFDAESRATTITLALPPGGADRHQIVVAVRKEADDPNPYLIELSDVALWTGQTLAPAKPLRRAASLALAQASPPPATRPARPAAARFKRLSVNKVYELQDYVDLDISIEGLSAGALSWPKVRFKLAIFRGKGHIEMRRGAQWPDVLSLSAPFRRDTFGEVLELDKAGLGAFLADRAGSPDAQLLGALAGSLPAILSATLPSAKMPEVSRTKFTQTFRDFADAAR